MNTPNYIPITTSLSKKRVCSVLTHEFLSALKNPPVISKDAAFENAVSATRWPDCSLHMTPFQAIYYSTCL